MLYIVMNRKSQQQIKIIFATRSGRAYTVGCCTPFITPEGQFFSSSFFLNGLFDKNISL